MRACDGVRGINVSVAVMLAACASDHPRAQAQTQERACLYGKSDRSEPGLGRPFPLTAEYQPRGHSGHTVVNVCVAADGKLAGDPTVVTSSGDNLVDQAVVTMLKAGTYCPAMDHDVAVQQCFKMNIGMGANTGQ